VEIGNRLAITFRYPINRLPDAQAALQAFLERNSIGGRAAYAAELVLEEAVTNILSYAFKDDNEHLIGITAAVDSSSVVLSFEDDGAPFDPCSVPEPIPATSLPDAIPGGLGVHLMRKMSESMHYTYITGRNRLEVRIAQR
jgi:anti-sigma regulatory factor (Ser/Thr protein kinase)